MVTAEEISLHSQGDMMVKECFPVLWVIDVKSAELMGISDIYPFEVFFMRYYACNLSNNYNNNNNGIIIKIMIIITTTTMTTKIAARQNFR